mmetsp:Transcript_3692/g.12244  ORF Transcript_3692/g.12244 Transcript_3692/m.12244 type:complete len:249 (+) Transcript_3692:1287-2033(+)
MTGTKFPSASPSHLNPFNKAPSIAPRASCACESSAQSPPRSGRKMCPRRPPRCRPCVSCPCSSPMRHRDRRSPQLRLGQSTCSRSRTSELCCGPLEHRQEMLFRPLSARSTRPCSSTPSAASPCPSHALSTSDASTGASSVGTGCAPRGRRPWPLRLRTRSAASWRRRGASGLASNRCTNGTSSCRRHSPPMRPPLRRRSMTLTGSWRRSTRAAELKRIDHGRTILKGRPMCQTRPSSTGWDGGRGRH